MQSSLFFSTSHSFISGFQSFLAYQTMSGRFSSAAPPSVSSSNNNTNVNIPGAGLGNNNNVPGGLGININNNGLPLLRATLVQVKKK